MGEEERLAQLGVAVAATPFARPVKAPVRLVCIVLGVGVLSHLTGLILYSVQAEVLNLPPEPDQVPATVEGA